ncbi:MAG: hypothetical protein ABEK36_01900 [Candidatus Aenigmatarchaeota archaeon]
MKGQVLVVIAIVVSIVVILIGIEADYVSSLHRRELKAGKDIINTLENLKNEYTKIVEISLSKEPSLSALNQNIMDFSAFVDKNLASKQSFLFYSVAESHDDSLEVGIGNFLGEDIVDVVITQNLTDKNIEMDEIGRGGREIAEFNVSPVTSENYTINISYMGASSNEFYHHSYTGKITSDKEFAVYYDLKVSLDDSYARERFQINEDIKG